MNATDPPEESADDGRPVVSLSRWVPWCVDTYELWDRIPACWARHPGMVAELKAAKELLATIEGEAAGDIYALGHGMADWHDYLGRMMERLEYNPARQCALGAKHREPDSWDRSGSAERRRAARASERPLAG